MTPMSVKDKFLAQWEEYFPGAELPLLFWYTDSPGEGTREKGAGSARHACVVCELARARRGEVLVLDQGSIGCRGGKRFLGFDPSPPRDLPYFLSHGIPGKTSGERFKKTPALVLDQLAKVPAQPAPAPFLVFARWDRWEGAPEPLAAVFFASPDVLSGLFTLANYDESDLMSVIAPFGAACATIVQYPLAELARERPRAILGSFDISARPCLGPGELTFSVPWPKFVRMAGNMEESFLGAGAWKKVKERLARGGGALKRKD